MKISRGWRVTAPAGHSEQGRTREFKALTQGVMANYLAAMDWYFDRPDPARLLPDGWRMVLVGDQRYLAPHPIKRITRGWRAKCPDTGVEPGVARDFSDPADDPQASLDHAIAWCNGKELVPRWARTEPGASSARPALSKPSSSLSPVTNGTTLLAAPKVGYGQGRGRNWDRIQEAKLLVLISHGFSPHAISILMDRTLRSLQQKAVRLGRPSHLMPVQGELLDPPDAASSADGWTRHDDVLIATWQGVVPASVIHRCFFVEVDGSQRRTQPAISHRATTLGLRLSRAEAKAIQDEADQVIQAARAQLREAGQVEGQDTHRTLRSPSPYSRSRTPAWSSEEDAILHRFQGTLKLAEIQRRFFSGGPGWTTRSYAAVAQRVGALGLSQDRASAARPS